MAGRLRPNRAGSASHRLGVRQDLALSGRLVAESSGRSNGIHSDNTSCRPYRWLARGYQEPFALCGRSQSPSPVDGGPTVCLCIGALRATILICRDEVRRTAGVRSARTARVWALPDDNTDPAEISLGTWICCPAATDHRCVSCQGNTRCGDQVALWVPALSRQACPRAAACAGRRPLSWGPRLRP